MTIIVYLIQNLVKSQQAKNCNKCKSVKSLKSVKSVTILKICGIRRIRIASIGLTRRSRRDDPLGKSGVSGRKRLLPGTLAHTLVVLHNALPAGHETSHNG